MNREAEIITAAQYLAAAGTARHIIQALTDIRKEYWDDIYKRADKIIHRYGTHWMRTEAAYTGDRALRLLIELFSISVLDRPLSLIDLVLAEQTYKIKYPSDEMSTNRIYYMIQSIRNGDAVVVERCKSCGHPFVVHRHDAVESKCNICKLLDIK